MALTDLVFQAWACDLQRRRAKSASAAHRSLTTCRQMEGEIFSFTRELSSTDYKLGRKPFTRQRGGQHLHACERSFCPEAFRSSMNILCNLLQRGKTRIFLSCEIIIHTTKEAFHFERHARCRFKKLLMGNGTAEEGETRHEWRRWILTSTRLSWELSGWGRGRRMGGGGCPCTHILDAGEVSSQHACCVAELD